jgi:hypothetical protein
VIDFNAGDVTLTHAANTLTLAGASSGYIFDAVIKPSANDGFALGVSGTAFSDLFLASGAVINFSAGDVTMTHAANTLTFAGANTYDLGTSAAFKTGTIELGHATDTTLARVSAGLISVEGVTLEPGANRCSFSAHKNASNQAIASTAATKVTFGTEVFDVGSKFATSTWTPVAGTVLISASLQTTGTYTGGEEFTLILYKNGAAYRAVTYPGASLGGTAGAVLSIVDQCNGTDTYEIYAQSVADSAYTINGATTATYFTGSMI